MTTLRIKDWRRGALALLVTSYVIGGISGAASANVTRPAPDTPNTTSARTDASASTATTAIEDFAFEQDIVVVVGTTLRWHNRDGVDHTVTADDGSFDSGFLGPSAAFDVLLPNPGVISYTCTIHPWMTGTITVEPSGDGGGMGTTPGETLASGATTVLRRTVVFDTDPLGIAGPALTLLVPDGWNVQGGPVWRHHYSNLASFEGRVTSPDLLRGVEYFAIFPQIWQEGGIPFFPEGSNYLGNDVRRPVRDVGAFIETLILPTYRGSFGARILGREPLPNVAAADARGSPPGTQVVAERVLTEHFVGGERMLEEFTVVLAFTPNPFVPGLVSWSAQRLFSIRAPAAEFEDARPVLQAIASSPVLDLDWYAGYTYVLDLSIRNGLEAIRAAGAASRIIADANAQTNDIIVAGYEERQATNNRVFDAVSQTIRGVETYNAPGNAGTYELPNGYSRVYGSPDGSVVLTNEPGFDPVQALPEQTWELLTIER